MSAQFRMKQSWLKQTAEIALRQKSHFYVWFYKSCFIWTVPEEVLGFFSFSSLQLKSYMLILHTFFLWPETVTRSAYLCLPTPARCRIWLVRMAEVGTSAVAYRSASNDDSKHFLNDRSISKLLASESYQSFYFASSTSSYIFLFPFSGKYRWNQADKFSVSEGPYFPTILTKYCHWHQHVEPTPNTYLHSGERTALNRADWGIQAALGDSLQLKHIIRAKVAAGSHLLSQKD